MEGSLHLRHVVRKSVSRGVPPLNSKAIQLCHMVSGEGSGIRWYGVLIIAFHLLCDLICH